MVSPHMQALVDAYNSSATNILPADFASLPPDLPFTATTRSASRDNLVVNDMLYGRIPSRLLDWKDINYTVKIKERLVFCTISVSPDWLGLGSNAFYLRIPLHPKLFQQVADCYDAMLCTSVAVDAIHNANVATRVLMKGLTPHRGETRNSTRLWRLSNSFIESARLGNLGLVSDGKKDVIVGPRQVRNRGKVCIYGAWKASGKWQEISTVHVASYIYYSQCARLMRKVMMVDGKEYAVEDIAKSAELWPCIVEEILPRTATLRYPT